METTTILGKKLKVMFKGNTPFPSQEGNYFELLETPEGRDILWLELVGNHWLESRSNALTQVPSVGDVVHCRERGGSVTLRVTDAARIVYEGDGGHEANHYQFIAVRGEWIDSDYIPVEEFLEQLEEAALRMGAPV